MLPGSPNRIPKRKCRYSYRYEPIFLKLLEKEYLRIKVSKENYPALGVLKRTSNQLDIFSFYENKESQEVMLRRRRPFKMYRLSRKFVVF